MLGEGFAVCENEDRILDGHGINSGDCRRCRGQDVHVKELARRSVSVIFSVVLRWRTRALLR